MTITILILIAVFGVLCLMDEHEDIMKYEREEK